MALHLLSNPLKNRQKNLRACLSIKFLAGNSSRTLFTVLILVILQGQLSAQVLTDMKQTSDPEQDRELSALFKVMNQFTYAFCQMVVYAEPDHSGGYKKISYQYNVIGVVDTYTQMYARKITYERMIKKNGVNFSDSTFRLAVLKSKTYDKNKAKNFFVSLATFGFDQLDNDCLTRTRFPDPNHAGWQMMEVLTDTQSESNFLLAHGKIRRVTSYLPEYIFIKHPGETECRAVYIICRNLFTDRIWNK